MKRQGRGQHPWGKPFGGLFRAFGLVLASRRLASQKLYDKFSFDVSAEMRHGVMHVRNCIQLHLFLLRRAQSCILYSERGMQRKDENRKSALLSRAFKSCIRYSHCKRRTLTNWRVERLLHCSPEHCTEEARFIHCRHILVLPCRPSFYFAVQKNGATFRWHGWLESAAANYLIYLTITTDSRSVLTLSSFFAILDLLLRILDLCSAILSSNSAIFWYKGCSWSSVILSWRV